MYYLLVGVLVFARLITAQYVGGSNGPCSAVFIPGPFGNPVNIVGNTALTGISHASNSICIKSDGPALWYTIQNQNLNRLSISTCGANTNFDTIISVYTGSCQYLTCLSYNDDAASCVYPHNSEVVVVPNEYELFWISVGGYGTATGIFQLTISEVGAPSDSCPNSIFLAPPYDNVFVYNSNSIGFGYNASCTSTSSHYSWYSISPQVGVPLNITTCSYYTNFDTTLSVFNSCSSYTCLYHNDDLCPVTSTASTINYIPTTSGKVYIAVGGYGVGIGNFELIIQQQSGISYSSECSNAPVMNLYQNWYGSTQNIAPLSDSPSCYNLYGFKTAWYSILGTGSTIYVSTCNSYTSFDTQIRVFAGTCHSLSCVSTRPYNGCYDADHLFLKRSMDTMTTSSRTATSSISPTSSLSPTSSPSPTSLPTRTPTRTASPSSNSPFDYGNSVYFNSVHLSNYYIVVTGITKDQTGDFLLYTTDSP